ncbi:MAG: SsrA-binding protein SmpB [Gemmatimonadota bacterium]
MSKDTLRKVVARNRKALHEYQILESWEAGLVLKGSEVKSLREGNASLSDAFARVEHGEVWLYNMHIGPYGPAGADAHAFKRRRKLLLHRQEIRRLIGKVEQAGLTLVPLEIYFSEGVAKLKLALARGKRHRDRREDIKQREAEREMARARKNR